MPTIQKGSRKRRLNGRIRRKPPNGRTAEYSPNQFVVQNDRTTHVVVPIDEYERMLQRIEVAELEAIADDPKTKWIDFEDFTAKLATDAVVEARKKAGLTQAQLAAKLKMPQSQISRIERNPDRTTVRTLKKIAKALGVNVSKLL